MNRNTCTLVRSLAALAGLPLSLTAGGSIINWNNAAGGSASLGTNWTPSGTPLATDNLTFALAATYAVTFNATAPTDATIDFNAGTVSISASSPHTSTSQLIVGHTGTATVNLTSGQFSVGGTVAMGGGANSGTLTVTGPTSSILGTSTNGIRVGNGSTPATGTLSILNGGVVQNVGPVLVGAFGSSQGTLLVSGVSGATHSRLVTTDPAAGDLTVASAGPGTLTLAAGGLVTIADDANIAPTTGFTGSMTIGSATANDSIATVAGDMLVGRNATAAAAGTGTVTVNDNGQLLVTGAINVGDPDGGTGTLLVNAVTNGAVDRVRCHDLLIDPVHGVLDFRNGLIDVVGGVFTPASPILNLNGAAAGNTSILNLSSGATLALDTINIGTTNSAQVSVVNSSLSLALVSIVGSAPTGTGLLVCSGFGSTITHNTLDVGSSGTGLLSIHTSGVVTGAAANIGLNPGSQGTVTVDGAGSSWNLGNLFLGGSAAAQGGDGDLNITNGGVVNVTGIAKIRTTGSLITLANGTIHAQQVDLANGSITGNGLLDAEILGSAGVSSITASGGPLTLGKATSNAGVLLGGQTLNVGAETVTLLDSTNARVAHTTINGGTLIAAHGIEMLAGATLSGTGTINGGITNLGAITATGVNGLTLNGMVNGIGQGISGTQILFGSGGGCSGSGTIAAKVWSHTGSTIAAAGNLTLGVASNASGVIIDGSLLVGSHTVTLLNSTSVPLGSVTELQGGTLVSAQNIVFGNVTSLDALPTEDLLRGFGTIQGNVVCGARIAPGLPVGDATGTLTITGTLNLDLPVIDGIVDIQLAGPGTADYDRLNIGGNATLAGTLNVSLINGYIPQPGDFHQIVTTGTGFVLGDFAVKHLPPRFVVLFGSNSYNVGIPCVADFDNGEGSGTPDGGVTIDDLLYYLTIFAQGRIEADVDDGSMTGTLDSGVTIDDLLYFLIRFAAGC